MGLGNFNKNPSIWQQYILNPKPILQFNRRIFFGTTIFHLKIILFSLVLFGNLCFFTGIVYADPVPNSSNFYPVPMKIIPEQIFTAFPAASPVISSPGAPILLINNKPSVISKTEPIPLTTVKVGSENNSSPDMVLCLQSGWNFISIPETLMPGHNTFSIFNPVQNSGHSLYHYQPLTGWTRLMSSDIIQPFTGYWIYAAQPYQVYLMFDKKSSLDKKTIHLSAGWNSIGSGNTSLVTIKTTFESIASQWLFLISFNVSSQTNDITIVKGWKGLGGEEFMLKPGIAYWIFIISDVDLTYSEQPLSNSIISGNVNYLVKDQGWTISLPGTVTGYVSQQTGKLQLSSQDAVISYEGKKYPITMNINAQISDIKS
jgi:hypothetical protein